MNGTCWLGRLIENQSKPSVKACIGSCQYMRVFSAGYSKQMTDTMHQEIKVDTDQSVV